MNHYAKYLLVLGCLAALVIIGLVGGPFTLYLATRTMILSIFALGYNLLLGRTGLLSFGHAAFFATGAYGLAITSIHLSVHPLLGIFIGVTAAAILALFIGFFCVRHTEIYFAMLTLAFGMMVFALIWNMRSITGGDDGLYGISRAAISLGVVNIPIRKDYQFYFFVASLFVVSVFIIHRIYLSPFGLALAGIRENHIRTEFAGISVKKYRLGVFTLSGAFAGLAGALSALLESNVAPFSAHWSHSAEPVLVSLIGGLQTFSGPIVGSIIFVALREVLQRFTYNWMLWFGILLLAIILGFRGGVVGSISGASRRYFRQ
ncbi:MAG: branched-chain amino acid ABC transporter permease [Deltaproteobacteria bacterium]|nr:branched-chain amino acid ABC transporter permease [Deltaproteobacteria bacterium]